jgi:transposase
MGQWVQRHRDAATLEERRLSGLKLLRSGFSQAEVARRLGVTPVAVCHWKSALDRGGPPALRAIPRPGRPPLVAREHQAALPEILAQGALAHGFSTDLWTIPRIVKVAEARWGVRYSATAMWRMLKRHGLSWQRPRRQAREKNLTQVRNWRRRSWPRYKKKPDAAEPS